MIKKLMQQYYISIDDIRWYLSTMVAYQIQEYRADRAGLVHLIWSKKLEDELYDMEERFIEETTREYEEGLIDEARIREILTDVMDAKNKRFNTE